MSNYKVNIVLLLFLYLSVYTVVNTIVYSIGVPYVLVKLLQSSKEAIILVLLLIYIIKILRLKLTDIDLLVLGFFLVNFAYFVLPIGPVPLAEKLLIFKSNVLFVCIYFIGRVINLRLKDVKKLNKYFLVLAVLSVIVGVFEVASGIHLHSIIGYPNFIKQFYNVSETQFGGPNGLTYTFQNSLGNRYASFFANPLEYASSAIIFLPIAIAYNHIEKGSIKSYITIIAIPVILILSFSRASSVSFIIELLFIIYIINRGIGKYILGVSIISVITLVIVLLPDMREYLLETMTFQESSSFGHLYQWLVGVESIYQNPFGYGLGSSGSHAARFSDMKLGGENQYLIYGVQLGLHGLLIYLGILYLAIKKSLKGFKKIPSSRKWICFIAAVTKFGMLLPLFTSNLETYLFISTSSWFFVGLSIQEIEKMNKVVALKS